MAEAMRLPVGQRRFKIKLTLERIAEPPEKFMRDGEPVAIIDHETKGLHLVHPFYWFSRDRKRVTA